MGSAGRRGRRLTGRSDAGAAHDGANSPSAPRPIWMSCIGLPPTWRAETYTSVFWVTLTGP